MKRDTIQFLTVILTCLATIVIALSNWQMSKGTEKLVKSSIETTDVIKKDFEITNRPYIQIIPYKTEFKLKENEIIVYFKNWGKSFASNILVDYGFEGFGMPRDWTGQIKYWSMAPGEIISCKITIFSQKEDFEVTNEAIQNKISLVLAGKKGFGLRLRWSYKWQNKTYPPYPEEAIANLLYVIDKETKAPKIHYYKSLEIVKMIDKAYKEQFSKVLEAVYVGMPKEDLLEAVGWLPQKGYHRILNKEQITFYNWTTKKPDDLVIFYLVDGEIKDWREK